MKKTISFILVFIMAFYILLSSFQLVTFKLSFFERNIEKNKIEFVTGKEKNELIRIYDRLLDYLKGERINLLEDFNEKEVRHMEDVENLFRIGFKVKRILGIIILVTLAYLIYDKKNIGIYLRAIKKSMILVWGLVLGFFILAMTDFTRYFTIFHEIFFDNDLWLLDPSKDLMIQMLPEEFFIGMFSKIVGVFILGLLILNILVVYFNKKEKERRAYV